MSTPTTTPRSTSEFEVGQTVTFDSYTRYGICTGTIEKVGRKNLTIRYCKGAGTHLFTTTVDPTVCTVNPTRYGTGTVENLCVHCGQAVVVTAAGAVHVDTDARSCVDSDGEPTGTWALNEGWRYADGEEEVFAALTGGAHQLDAKGDVLIPVESAGVIEGVGEVVVANLPEGVDLDSHSPGSDGYLTPVPQLCDARPSGITYVCTRVAGHAGDHAAHQTNGTQVARWAQASPAPDVVLCGTCSVAIDREDAVCWQCRAPQPFNPNAVSAIADVDVPRKFLRGFDESVQTVYSALFGELVQLAQPYLEHFHGDLFHDAKWIEEHVTGPICFFFGADDSGTAIGTDSALVRQARRHVWQVQLVDDGGAWYVRVAKRYER